MTLKTWPLQRTWVIPAHSRHKKSEVILDAGIDMAGGCLMDKQKYRPAFYRLNQEGFIRWAKSRDNIVNRDIWNKMALSLSSLLPQPLLLLLWELEFPFLNLFPWYRAPMFPSLRPLCYPGYGRGWRGLCGQRLMMSSHWNGLWPHRQEVQNNRKLKPGK